MGASEVVRTNEKVERRRVEVLHGAVKLQRCPTLLAIHRDRKEISFSRRSWLGKRPTAEGQEYIVEILEEEKQTACRC